ncbi:hypothetical protein ACVI1L_003826 [Bradyrhizobium sp. USDA 4516]
MFPHLPPLELRNISPIEHCVYCDSREGLSREHVMPRGMSGAVTLPAGSCDQCAKITKRIETTCMRGSLLHARVKYALHNTPSERPEGFPIKFTASDGRRWTQKVRPDEFPITWMLPVLEQPGIISGVTPEESKLGILTIKNDDELYQKLLRRPGVHSVQPESGGVVIDQFYRWIAKIAFCYAVARFGYQHVADSALRSLVREWHPHANYVVGGKNELALPNTSYKLEQAEPLIFRVRAYEKRRRNRRYLCVELRLLPIIETPTYLAVVKELSLDAPETPHDAGYQLHATSV